MLYYHIVLRNDTLKTGYTDNELTDGFNMAFMISISYLGQSYFTGHDCN